MARSPLVLAIDLGTSGPKVALVDDRAQVVASVAASTALHQVGDGGVEQDPHDWWRALVEATADLRSAGGWSPDDVVAVAVCAMLLTTVPTAADGSPVGPAMLWMDSRGAAYVDEITGGRPRVAGYGAARLRRFLAVAGGIPGHSGKDVAAQILWLRHERPDVVAASRWFLEPGDWLTLQLTGRAVSSVDTAAISWTVDVRDLAVADYDSRLLEWCQVPREQLPQVVPSSSVVGPLRPRPAAELGLPVGVPVVTSTGDMQASLVGSGAVGTYQPHLYLGTSSWLVCHVPRKRVDILRNQTTVPSAVPGRTMVANEQESAGACLLWLREWLARGADLEALVAQARPSLPGAGGVLFTPWLNGERTPVDDRTVRAGFHNLTATTTRPDLIAAVLEGVAYNSRWLHESVQRFVRRSLPVVDVVGGGAQSDEWCQVHADVLGVTVRQRAEPRLAGVRGAAMLAWLATGQVGDVEALAREVPVEATYAPDAGRRQAYDEIYREYRQVYRRTRSIYRRLNASGRPGSMRS